MKKTKKQLKEDLDGLFLKSLNKKIPFIDLVIDYILKLDD